MQIFPLLRLFLIMYNNNMNISHRLNRRLIDMRLNKSLTFKVKQDDECVSLLQLTVTNLLANVIL